MAEKKISVYIVDDDTDSLKLMTAILTSKGYAVKTTTSSVNAYPEIISLKPDLIISDIMMPIIDGLELTEKIRSRAELNSSRIVIVSAKPYEYDKQRALAKGADGYIVKPIVPADFLKKIEEIISPKIILTFWGVRGTLPVPGQKTLKYGGNTSCVSLFFPQERIFIFDGGSGIKELSNYLLSRKKLRFKANLFISHPHWDHINGLPFFVPLYIPGNELEICGAAQGDLKMRQIISAQMEGIYFPVTIREFGARVYFKDLTEDTYEVDKIAVKTKLLTHPGCDLGYQINFDGKRICYITDNELYPAGSPYYSLTFRNQLIDFVQEADILIHECTYFDEEYARKINWGHSAVSEVADLAHQAGVKDLYIFHHDPDHADEAVERKLEAINKILQEKNSGTRCLAAVEQEQIILPL